MKFIAAVALVAFSATAAPAVAAAPTAVTSTATPTLPAPTLPAQALTVRFTGIETPTGAVLLALFASEAAFDAGGQPVASLMAPVQGSSAEAVFPTLPPGRYAIKAFHDVDGDGKMGTTPFGMPSEPFAFSNNAIGNAGPAKWAAASFDLGAASAVHTITIR